jgi:hypothetical protein
MKAWDVRLTLPAPGGDVENALDRVLTALEADPRIDAWTTSANADGATVSAHLGVDVAGGMAEAINIAAQAFVAAATIIGWEPDEAIVEAHATDDGLAAAS